MALPAPYEGEEMLAISARTSWGFEPGDAIVPGLVAHKLLGGGHRYEAYLATDEDLLYTVVVKLPRPDRLGDPSSLKTLRREARVLSALNHPVIARMLNARFEGDRPHLTLEHIEGPRLSTLIRRYGPLMLEQAIPLTLQLAAALHYMHGRGWVHLDVKPRNIIMAGPPRLIDMSVAHTAAEANQISTQIGTDAYMAPEQCDPTGRGPVGTAADIWGLGVTLYEAITGTKHFRPGPEGGSLKERFPQLNERPRPSAGDMPSVLAVLLDACLDPEPDERPSAHEVTAAIEPLIEALPTRPRIGRLKPR